MKKRCTIILYILLCFLSCIAQREDANWIVGYANGSGGMYGITKVSFDTIYNSPPIFDTISSPIAFLTNNAIISDENANVLFYTNGAVVMNSQNDTMQNGKGLSPCNYTSQYENDGLANTQGSLILPVPTHKNLYYLVHETIYQSGEPYADNFLYSVVDIDGDNGNGTITQKNVPTLSNKQLSVGKITACKHANGQDWWIIKPDFYADKYYKFLLQADGLHGPYIQTFNDTTMHAMSNDPDQCGFTPNGSIYVHSCARSEEKVFVFDFDRCTGELNLKDLLKTQGLKTQYDIGGVVFSPNSQYMYFVSFDSLYQFDLSIPSISSTKQFIAAYDGFYSPTPVCKTSFFMGITAPNGKIYIGPGNSADRLHVINNPDSAGLACDFQQHAIQIPKNMAFGLPNFPNYHLGALSGSTCDTLTSHQAPINHPDIKLYPNPANETLSIEIPQIKPPLICIFYNLLGQKVHQQTITQSLTKINISEWQKGAYYYEISNENEKHYGNIFIQ